jgi:hypothetical protein
VTEEEKDEKTDADVEAGQQEWGEDDATEVDARPPVDAPRETGKAS